MSEQIILALKVLLTGFVVVFAVLLLLIAVIKIYGTIVYKAQSGGSKKEKVKKEKAPAKKAPIATPVVTAAPQPSGAIPEEIVAVIAAAVDAMYGSEQKVRIKSIVKAPSQRSNWAMAGVLDNTRPF